MYDAHPLQWLPGDANPHPGCSYSSKFQQAINTAHQFPNKEVERLFSLINLLDYTGLSPP